MTRASVTLRADMATPISVVESGEGEILIVIGGNADDAKVAVVMPNALADLMSARISATRIRQSAEQLAEGFTGLAEAAADVLVDIAQKRVDASAPPSVTKPDDKVVDLKARRP